MKEEGLKERVELLEAGEKLGYPRLGYGRSTKIPHDKRIPPGQQGWETFCAHAHIRRILPALRIARVLRDNNVMPFHPLSGAESAPPPVFVDGDNMRLITKTNMQTGEITPVAGPDLLDDAPDLPPVAIVTVEPARRVKKGGHKQPPHPLSARARRG